MHGIREMEDVFADEIAAMTDRRNLLRDHFAGLAMQIMLMKEGFPLTETEAAKCFDAAANMIRAREAGQ